MEKTNIENVAKAYQKVRTQQDLLAIQEQELKAQMLDFMKTEDVKTIDGKYGNFTYSTRTMKVINDPRVAEKEVELKKAKEVAIEDGMFEEKSTDVLTYKPVKKD